MILGREKGAFGLDYRFHTSFFQMLANCVRREGLVGDGGECLGDLDSIFSFARGNKMDSMMNVGRRKLGWVTSNRLLKSRALLCMKSGYGSKADTCAGGNRVS